jgi:hypothetical protein
MALQVCMRCISDGVSQVLGLVARNEADERTEGRLAVSGLETAPLNCRLYQML